MRKLLIILAAFVVSFPSFAADNTVILTPGSGVTMKSKDVGSGVQAMQPIISDATGTALGTTTNPLQVGSPISVFVDGWSITHGAKADAACATDTGTCSLVALQKRANQNLTSSSITTGTAGTPSAVVLSVQDPTDPCKYKTKTFTPISITTATTTRIVAPSASNRTYICNLFLTSAAADNVGIVEGTGGTCGSGTAGVIGGTTAANGPNFPANGGFSIGSGVSTVAATAGTNVDLCLITSAATPLAGTIGWVQSP